MNKTTLDSSMMPREKMMAGGIKTLTNAELMALLFTTGIKGKPVIELCEDILKDNRGHLSLVTKLSVKELCERYKGIGQAKAIILLAALELGARSIADEKSMDNPQIVSSTLGAEIMRHRFLNLDHEEFWVMYLNNQNRIIRETRVSQGGITATLVDPKVVLRTALECGATGIILFHNHPSGSLNPSIHDDHLTRKIKEGTTILEIRLLDHIIVTNTSHYSYRDNGKL